MNKEKFILVIDDDSIVCRAFEKELAPFGFLIDSAYDSYNACEMAK